MIATWWRRSRSGTVALVLIWMLCAAVATAVLLEFALEARALILQSTDASPRTRLLQAYDPFVSERLHPFYLFGFPLAEAERQTMGNSVCSLDRHGFREPALERRGKRKLAFLLGGSVSFGLFASSNETTITAYLNRQQDEYFFINAGVPGFNSTQELMRLTLEAADYSPALIVALNGWNDATLAAEPWWIDDHLPPAVPPPYPTLDEWVRQSNFSRDFSAGRLFPELSDRVTRVAMWVRGPAPRPPATESAIRDSAVRYRRNLERMHQVSSAIGARFIGVFQPLLSLHHRRGPEEEADSDLVRFHQHAVAAPGHRGEFYDLGNVFDAHLDRVRASEAIDAPELFFDEGHLHDRGNEIVARHLIDLIKSNAPSP